MGDSLKEGEISLTKLFDEQCPYYLAIGMTYNEFWLDNPLKVKYYKEAYEIKQKIKKYEFWEQGAYFYESLINVSPLFKDLVKQPKAEPYPERPYGIEETKKSEAELLQEAENERLRARIHFETLFKQLAKNFANKESKE